MLVLGLCPKGFVENQEEPVSSQASFVALGCQTQQESKQNQGKEAQDGISRPLDQRAEEWLPKVLLAEGRGEAQWIKSPPVKIKIS